LLIRGKATLHDQHDIADIDMTFEWRIGDAAALAIDLDDVRLLNPAPRSPNQ